MFASGAAVLGQTPPASTSPQNDANRMLLSYIELLDKETQNHHDYIERYSLVGGGAFLVLLTLVGGALTWMNWKSRSDVKAEVRSQLTSIVQQEIERERAVIERALRQELQELQEKVRGVEAKSSEASLEVGRRELSHLKAARSTGGTVQAGFRILWVDDHPSNNKQVEAVLREAGASIVVATTSADALSLLSQDTFDVVISDMNRDSNRHEGVDFTAAVRKRYPNLPICIFCSSRSVREYGTMAEAQGAIEVTSSEARLLKAIGALQRKPLA
jgi:CheY-like chemotaxis protein